MSLPVWIVVLPLLAAFLLPLNRRVAVVAGELTGPVTLGLVLLLALDLGLLTLSGGPVAALLGGFQAPFGIVLYGDPLAALFAALLAGSALLLWPRGGSDPVREQTLVLLLVGGGCGLALSGDLFNLFVFYEITAVASYGLAASRGTGLGQAAALRYLVLSATGSALALLGIGLIYAATGTLNLADLALRHADALASTQGLAAFALILVGFGVKAELFPLNGWVPEVYGHAPHRVSALLAGAVSKLALLVVLRLLVLAYGATEAAQLLLAVGILGVLSGELAAYRANDLRRMLGFSSIGQLGLVAIALAVPGEAGVMAAIALAVHHLIAKPALFLLSGGWHGSIDALAGGFRRAPLASLIFVLFALSLIGVPPLPGFWGKLLLVQAALAHGGNGYLLAVAVVFTVTVIEAAYLFRVVRLLFQRDAGERAPVVAGADLFGAGVLALLLLTIAAGIGPVSASLESIAAIAADADSYIRTVLPQAAPAAFGVVR